MKRKIVSILLIATAFATTGLLTGCDGDGCGPLGIICIG
jgi:hypothetical protein